MPDLALHPTKGEIETRQALNEEVVATTKSYMNSEELEKIAASIIKKHSMTHISQSPAQIEMILVYPNISKKKPARTKKVNGLTRHMTGFDYTMEFSGELWDMLDHESREYLVWEELLKIDPTFKTKTQEWKMQLRKPNYSNFYEIISHKGSEEAQRLHETIQATASSLYDLDPKQEDQISLF